MKKITLLLFSTLMFIACSDHDFEPYDGAKAIVSNYNTKFIEAFGQPNKNHNWGFGSIVALTRGHDVNGNLWYQNWVRPKNVTDEEAQKVIAEFSKVRRNQQATETFQWENYWVQQVYKGESTYNDGNGASIGVASDKMNKLIAYNQNYVEEVYWPQRETIHGGYEHVNNFNNGNNTTVYTDDVTHQKYIGTTLMVNMAMDNNHGGTQFGYHNTVDSKDHFEYIILQIDGAYYVGFDFYAKHPDGQEANKNMDVERDWIFNDWIVKISEAKRVSEYDVRIIAEDLSVNNASDFDFNDVVFDIKYTSNTSAKVCIVAAGGTLPLTVDGREVHALFDEANPTVNVSTKTMVNTGNGAVNGLICPIIEVNNINKSLNGKDIKIIVQKNNVIVELSANEGEPAAKIAVDPSFEYCSEREDIRTKYGNFPQWVQDPSVIWY